MELSSANRSEIHPDISNRSFKFLASYTQIEKLQNDLEWYKHMIFNGIMEKEDTGRLETLIKLYEDAIKKIRGYGYEVYYKDHQENLHHMYAGVEDLKNED